MIPFGKTLREAREAKGLTIAQIAEKTRMMSVMVQDLENENFSRLAAPIYGRGFVKLYCEAVGLDPKPLVAEFMDLYSGNREPTIRERPVAATPQPAPAVEPTPLVEPAPAVEVPPAPVVESAPVAEVPPTPAAPPRIEPQPVPPPLAAPIAAEPPARPVVLQPGLFDPQPAAQPVRPTSPLRPAAPVSADPSPDDLADETETPPEKPTFARYASPLADRPAGDIHDGMLPPQLWRWALLAIALLLILWGAAVGLKTLYKATTTQPVAAPDTATTIQPKPAEAKPAEAKPVAAKPVEAKTAPAAKPVKAKARKPQDIPPLYLD